MTLDSQRGDIGNLALADAALGALLIQIAEMVEEANYPDPPKKISQSLPTGRAARLVEKQVACYADLFPDQFGAWLEQVVTATDMRNKIMHAVAVDTCVECGNATLFDTPRAVTTSTVPTRPCTWSPCGSRSCISEATATPT